MAKYKAKARVTKDQALKLQPLFSKFDKLYATENTIQREIAEYISHNDGCMGARMFLLPRHEFAHGEYNHTIYWDDGME